MVYEHFTYLYQVGCGTTDLSKAGFWDDRISNEEFEKERDFVARSHGIQIRDKEHLHYYRAFRCDLQRVKMASFSN